MKKFKSVINETRRTALMNPLSRNKDSEYFNEVGLPCCLFGHVFERLGIPASEVVEGYSVPDLPWEAWGFEKPNEYEAVWTSLAQTHADNGDVWIIAIAMSDASVF